MMNQYTYLYDDRYHPPMPIVDVDFYIPGRDESGYQAQAIIDTGSDGTLVPLKILDDIGARYVKSGSIRGITGGRQLVDIYLVGVRVGPYDVRAVRVVGILDEKDVILGRNAISGLVITLNGPAGVVEMSA